MPKTANKPVIAVDIDEVLFPLAPTFLNYYNEQSNTSYSVSDMTSYYLEEITGETKEVMLAKIEAYLGSEHHTTSQPVEGAIEAISKLHEKYSLIVITARAPFFGNHSQSFLEKYFKGLYDGFYNIHRDDVEHKDLSKAQVCKEISAIALVDDHLNYVLDAAKHGIEGVLFGDYAWNRAENLPKNVTRVKDWPAVLEYFDAR